MLTPQQRAIIAAIECGDWDQAMQLGLLELEIDDTWPNADVLRQMQRERRFALQSRERYLAKLRREDERQQALQRKRAKASQTTLPSVAQAALERAKASAAMKKRQ